MDVNMLRKLLIFMLICMTKCKRYPHYSVENLYAILDQTSAYFKNLNNVYNSSNVDISNIDDEIAKYMETTTKVILQRQKRMTPDTTLYDIYPSITEVVNVLQNFEENLHIDLPDFEDIAFVFIEDEYRLLWFAAVMDSTRIMLFQLFDSNSSRRPAFLSDFYIQPNGKRIMINNYGTDIITVVQTSTDEIVILRLGKTENGTSYEFQFKQEFEIPRVVHTNMWFAMNQLYLGIASDTKVFLYAWLGEHFDQIDTLHYGARELLFFQHKSFMHVVVVGSLTRIFRFSVRSNKFIETQKLHGARNASLFHFKEDRFEEHFLVLADDNSTILYKEMYNRFVPFQRFASARYVYSFMIDNTVLLFIATEEDSVVIYQYNGWRFVELHVRLSNILQIRQTLSYDGDMLMVQSQAGGWKFLRPMWTIKKTWQALRNEIEAWCSEVKRKASKKKLGKIDLKNPVKIPNAYIDQLRTQRINNHNATELIHLTKQYRKTISKLILANRILTEGASTGKSMRTVLYGKKVTVQCKTNCHVHRLETDTEIEPILYKFRKLNIVNNTLKFTNLKAKVLNNWKCPIPNFAIDDIFVKKFVNGMLIENLQEGTLKISGDQEVSGEHFFNNLNVTSISIPLNIATHNTSVILRINEARVEKFNLIKNEFFLPLNGPTITMTGSITAAKVKVVGLIKMKGKITGESAKKLTFLKDIYTPLILPYDCFLQNVTFRNLIRAKDIVSTHKSSLKQILEDSIPLDSDVPKHVILFSDKIQWDNVTILDYQNWVTKNSTDTIIISGAKFATNNIILTNTTYENLPIPKLTVPVCAAQVATQDITSSLIMVDDLVVKHLYVQNVTGARDLNSTMFDSVSTLRSVDFSTKLFIGQVFVKNISVSEIKGIDAKELESHGNKWRDVDHIEGPVNASKLLVKTLQTPVNLNLSLPTRVNTVIILGNSNIGKINDVNMSSFIENVQKVDDKISLEYTIFIHGFASNHINASYSTLNVSHIDAHLNLHSKRISSTLETSGINVPQTFGYVASNVSPTFVIEGTARFEKEPVVQNIKDVNLEELFENLWMSDQNTIISGSNMYLKNMSIKEKIVIRNAVNSLNINVWLDLSSKLLSKTKQQNITVAASFKNVVVSAIIAVNNSTLQTSDPDLSNLLTNSLMKNKMKAQIVDAIWNFEELIINNLYWNGKFNDIDLNTEIVRYDTEQNIITGKKTIVNFSTTYLWSYNKKFSKFVKYALTEKCFGVTIVKGRKTFKNISLDNLSVKGKLMGHNIEQALLKSGNQTIFGVKKIHGHLNVSSLITDSAVNDVLLTQLINDQLKNHELIQTIETEIDFRKNLEVFGNITISKLYEGTDLNNISDNSGLDAVLSRTAEVMELADNIKVGLYNPAIYVDKFEEVDENTLEITTDPDTEDVMALNSTCVCEPKNLSQFCNDMKLLNILASKNSSTFIMTRLVLLDDIVFIVIISSDLVSVYTYAAAEEDLHQRAELHIPDILQASVESANHALWIALRLPKQTLVLRYQAWNEFEQYVLPASDTLVISKTPNNQHLLILSDGVWNLGGVFHPEYICKLSLNGEIKAFALNADYYVKVAKKNNTIILKARYVGN